MTNVGPLHYPGDVGNGNTVINIRIQTGSFGVCVAVVKEYRTDASWATRRADILSTRYGGPRDLRDMLRSAQTEAEMALSEAEGMGPERGTSGGAPGAL